MKWARQKWMLLLPAAACLIAATSLVADTIVLKNGRRISALSVSEEGDKISYETASGTLTLPRSIVDHIERGGMASVEGPASGASVSMTAPEIKAAATDLSPNASEIEKKLLHDGGVDRNYLADLETEARSGKAVANQNAAMGHHTAANFEASHGEMEQAVDDERSALTYAPEQPVLLMNLAYLYLRRSEYTQSLDYLERARRLVPEDPEVSKLTGWAYYGLNKLDQAVAEWQHSLSLRPDAEVEAALKKAQRDKQEEEQYKENESRHFMLRYSGAALPSMANEVLHTLERHYEGIESELNYSPPDSIGVILYTQQAFADITQAPDWVGALNDGRIRVPVQGLNAVTPDLSRVLKHELTHSFIQQKTQGRAPTWVQEGLAQWMEGKRSDANAGILVTMYQKDPQLVERHFGEDWMKLSTNEASIAYAWALANVECILSAGGMDDMDRLLDRLGAGDPPDVAVKSVLRVDLADFTAETAEYLQKTYGR